MNRMPVLILGLGNLLMGDEGLGVHVAWALEKMQWPEEVDILDGGTGGFQLMSWLESYEHVIMIDATLDKNSPGTVRQIRPRFVQDYPSAMSTHEIGLKDLIQSMALMGTLPEIHLFAVSIEEVQPLHIGLSTSIEEKLPDLISQIRQLAYQLIPTEVV